jgi:transglutaminase-like putative cysteine protease
MKRAALAVLFGASAASFATTLPSLPAFSFAAVAVVSLFWRSSRPAPAWTRRLAHFVFAALLVYGWILVIYPVMSAESRKLWSLLLGYALGALGALFLVTGSAVSVLCSIGLAVVSCFDLQAGVHPFLYGAGAAGFVYLAEEVKPGLRFSFRAILLALSGALSGTLGVLIVVLLPWTQGKVEETMMNVYSPPTSGGEGEDRSRLGELRRMKLSSRVIMRVWSERPQRLRSRALVRFDGRTWYADPSSVRPLERQPGPPALDAASRAFVDGIPGASFVPDPASLRGQRLIATRVLRIDGGGLATPGGTRLVRAPLEGVRIDDAGIFLSSPEEAVWRYAVLHDVDHRRAQEEAPDGGALAAAVQLPGNLDARIRDLSDRLARGAPDRQAVVDRVVTYLRDNYSYSLDLPVGGSSDPLAGFLFESKRGWCEYFAGAAAVLLRAQAIPARYVRGLNVVGSQRVGDHYVVREWDRHAWIDVYLEGKGWIEYDPTPAAEYESLHAGMESGTLTDILEQIRASAADLYASLRTFEWTSLGRPALLLAALIILFRAADGLARLRPWGGRRRASGPDRTPTPIELLAKELDGTLASLGCPRPPSRAPLEHFRRLPVEKLPLGLREASAAIVETYYRARFGGERISDDEIGALRRLLSERRPAS